LQSRVDVPTVLIGNLIESFHEFLRRAPIPARYSELVGEESADSQIAYLWTNARKKLVITSEAPYLPERWARPSSADQVIQFGSPRARTHSVCTDIVNDPVLLSQISTFIGDAPGVSIIPYCATAEFADLCGVIGRVSGKRVITPEFSGDLQIRDKLDKKSEFRKLVQQLFADKAPLAPGGTALRAQEAIDLASSLLRRDSPCVIKPDIGASGIGSQVFRPGIALDQLSRAIRTNSFLADDACVVEQFIEGEAVHSPSLEFYAGGDGESRAVYCCSQLLSDDCTVSSILISPLHQHAPWYEKLANICAPIARHVAKLGYRGYFDIDAIVTVDGEVLVLEMNTRRTTGTHVNDFRRNYLQPLLGDDLFVMGVEMALPAEALHGRERDFIAELIVDLEPLMWHAGMASRNGLVISSLAGVACGRVCFVFFAESTAALVALHDDVRGRLRKLLRRQSG
jgi:ATP-grasp domain